LLSSEDPIYLSEVRVEVRVELRRIQEVGIPAERDSKERKIPPTLTRLYLLEIPPNILSSNLSRLGN